MSLPSADPPALVADNSQAEARAVALGDPSRGSVVCLAALTKNPEVSPVVPFLCH